MGKMLFSSKHINLVHLSLLSIPWWQLVSNWAWPLQCPALNWERRSLLLLPECSWRHQHPTRCLSPCHVALSLMAAASESPSAVKITLLVARNVLPLISAELSQLLAEARRHGETHLTGTDCSYLAQLPACRWGRAASGPAGAVRRGLESGRERGDSLSSGLRLRPPSQPYYSCASLTKGRNWLIWHCQLCSLWFLQLALLLYKRLISKTCLPWSVCLC